MLRVEIEREKEIEKEYYISQEFVCGVCNCKNEDNIIIITAKMMTTMKYSMVLLMFSLIVGTNHAFSPMPRTSSTGDAFLATTSSFSNIPFLSPVSSSSTKLYMSDGGRERQKKTKKGKSLLTIERTEAKSKEEKRDESQWRVILHNDEVHTFNYVVDALTKILPEYNKKKAFDLCVVVHGSGKGTVTTVWKDKAEQYCMGLQRHGLTVSIAPDKNFKGGGDGDGDGGGDGGDGPGPSP